MNDRPLIRLAASADVKEASGRVIECHGHEIALFRNGDEVYAVSNICPHQHIPVIAEGARTGSVITCPMHGWSFDLRTGKATGGSGSLRTFPVTLRDGGVWIEEPDPPKEPMW